jgi:hypothetical protein
MLNCCDDVQTAIPELLEKTLVAQNRRDFGKELCGEEPWAVARPGGTFA